MKKILGFIGLALFVYFLIYLVLPVGIIVGVSILIYVICVEIEKIMFENFQKKYYASPEFQELKSSVEEHIKNCNELNEYIDSLKNFDFETIRNHEGKSNFYDSSNFNYKRPEYRNHIQKRNVYNCSRTICDNARMQPFKYVCKYFNISYEEEDLQYFEDLLNKFISAQDGIQILRTEKKKILDSIIDKIPLKIKARAYERFQYNLGFTVINFQNIVFPKYTFLYVSPGGNASTSCDVVMDIDNLNEFILFLSEKIDFRKSVAGQRALMTSSLRKRILERDEHTCCQCGVSINDEPTLLLEIDHIHPLSKGGMTTEDNLQTLCWKCNRSKGNKIV